MALNEADPGLPVVEGSGPRRHHHHPGSVAPATAPVSASKHWNRSSSPAPVHWRVVCGCTHCGALPLYSGEQLELSLHSWRTST